MLPTEPLPLHHSWPMSDAGERLDLGRVHDGDPAPGFTPAPLHAADRATGRWACDLATNMLTWSSTVYRLFGMPQDNPVDRGVTVSMYAERSRAAMERLRTHAIRHRRGFTLDIQIAPLDDVCRWLRLTAAPICDAGRVVSLHGYKTDVSDLYRRGPALSYDGGDMPLAAVSR